MQAIFAGAESLLAFHRTLLDKLKTERETAQGTREQWTVWHWLDSSSAVWGDYVNNYSTTLFALKKALDEVSVSCDGDNLVTILQVPDFANFCASKIVLKATDGQDLSFFLKSPIEHILKYQDFIEVWPAFSF